MQHLDPWRPNVITVLQLWDTSFKNNNIMVWGNQLMHKCEGCEKSWNPFQIPPFFIYLPVFAVLFRWLSRIANLGWWCRLRAVSPRLSEVKPTRCVCYCVTLLRTSCLLWRASATPAAQPTTWSKSSETWVDGNAGSTFDLCQEASSPELSSSSERNSLFRGGSTEAARPEGLVWAGLFRWGWGWVPPRLHSGPLPHGPGQGHLAAWWD